MKRKFLLFLLALIIFLTVLVLWLTQDGSLDTPKGEGIVRLEADEFEAFPLPKYVAEELSSSYKSYFIEVAKGIKIHVLEVGSGYPVLLQHGNPTSGLLYRKVAEHLPTNQLRLIMPTLVGLGYSSKVPASQHTLSNHVEWLSEAIAQLQLKQLIFVGQDWGGPIGMGALSQAPTLLQGAIILNTGLNAPKEKRSLSSIHATMKTPVLGELLLETVTSIFARLHTAQGDPESMPKKVKDLYARPVLESGNAKAPLALLRMVPDGPDHPTTKPMRSVEDYALGLSIPIEIVWGMNDPILGKSVVQMRENFPAASVVKTQGGHFLQEEVPEVIASAIVRVFEAL